MAKYNKSKSKDTVDLSKVLNTLVSTLSQNTAAIKSMSANSKSDSDKPKPKPVTEQDSTGVAAAKAEKASFELAQDRAKFEENLNKIKANGADEELKATELINDAFEEKIRLAKDLDKAQKAGNKDLEIQLQAQINTNDEAIKYLDTQVEIQKKQEGINKEFDKTVESSLELVDNLTSVNKLGSSFKKKYEDKVKAGLKNLRDESKSFQAGMIASIATVALVAKGIDFLAKRVMANADQAELLHDKFGGSEKSIQNLKSGLKDLASNTKIVGANQEDVNASFDVLQKEFGTAVINNQELIDGQILLTKKIGMSAEQASNFRGQSVLSGVSIKDNVATIELQTELFNEMQGTSFSIHEVQQDVAEVSLGQLAAYKGQNKQLNIAVLQAKKLGMTLDKAADHTRHLLDFEASVHDEMSANVLTGKHINLNEARRLKLNGKSAEAMAYTLKQIGPYEEFVNQDVLSKEALANLADMTVDELMATYKQQKINGIMNKKSYKDLTDSQKASLISQKLLTKEGIEQATKEEERATISAKMSKIGDNLLSIFDRVFEGPISAIVDGITSAIGFTDKMVKKMGELSKTNPLLGAIARIGSMVGLVAAVAGGIFLYFNSKFKKKKLVEDSQKANIEVPKLLNGQVAFNKSGLKMADAATKKHSIYTHDTHSETLLQEIANKDFGGGGDATSGPYNNQRTNNQRTNNKRNTNKNYNKRNTNKNYNKRNTNKNINPNKNFKTKKYNSTPGLKRSTSSDAKTALFGAIASWGIGLATDYFSSGEAPDSEDLGNSLSESLTDAAPSLAVSAVTQSLNTTSKPGGAGIKPPAPNAGPLTKSGKPDMRFKANQPGGAGIKPPPPETGGGFFSGLKNMAGKAKNFVSEKAGKVKDFAGKGLNYVSKKAGGVKDLAGKGLNYVSKKAGSVKDLAGKGLNYVAKKAGSVKALAEEGLDALNPMNLIKKHLPKLFKSKMLGKVLNLLGSNVIGKIISAGMNIYSVGSAASDAAKSGESEQAVGKSVIQALGSVGGSIIGGMLGAVIGSGVASVPLSMLFSYLGSLGGEALSGLIADNIDAKPLGKATMKLFGADGKPIEEGVTPTADPPEQKALAMKDALIRPGQPPISFDKGDLILAGTNLLGEGKTNSNPSKESSEVAALLKELIKKIDQPVKINIGGKVINEMEKIITMNKTYNTIGSGYSG